MSAIAFTPNPTPADVIDVRFEAVEIEVAQFRDAVSGLTANRADDAERLLLVALEIEKRATALVRALEQAAIAADGGRC